MVKFIGVGGSDAEPILAVSSRCELVFTGELGAE
jgi:hypothetical protein